MIRRGHDGEKLGRLRDVVEDRPIRWHKSGLIFRATETLSALREKISGSVETHGEIQVGLLVEIRDIYLDAIESAWTGFPAAGRASLKARLPEMAGPGEEFAQSAARLAAAINEVLAAHPQISPMEYITPAERAWLKTWFEQEVEA